MLQQNISESGWAIEFGAIGKYGGGVDRGFPIAGPPTPCCIEVFQGETQRVHRGMTVCARGILAVILHELAQWQLPPTGSALV